MLRLAWRNLIRHRLRTGLTSFAVASAVACLIVAGGFVEDIFSQLRETTIRSQLGHAQITREGFRNSGQSMSRDFFVSDTEALRVRLQGRPDVEQAMMRLHFSGLVSMGRASVPIIGEGVEPARERRLGASLQVLSGRHLQESDQYGAMLGEGIAAALSLEPGDSATLMLTTPDGALNTLDVVVIGVFRTFAKEYDDRAVRISLSAAQELIGEAAVDTVVVVLRDTAHTHAFIASESDALKKSGLEVATWEELADYYRQAVALYGRLFGVLQVIMIILTAIVAANSISMNLFERRSEIGTSRALGEPSSRVGRQLLAESLMLAAVGSVLGMVIGACLAGLLSALGIPMPPPPNANAGFVARVQLDSGVVATAAGIGFLSTALAAIAPIRRSLSLPITEALRSGT